MQNLGVVQPITKATLRSEMRDARPG